MGRGLRLFSVRGIDIRVHVTFPLILVWASLQFGLLRGQGWEGALFGVIVTSLLFAIVVLHELGHSLAAQRYGVPVKQIVLLPIGGLAQLARMPEEPLQEFVIAVAGPLVNFGLAAVMFLLRLLADPGGGLATSMWALLGGDGLSLGAVFNYLFVANLGLGFFNLIPAFPMDGGRILRALLATRFSYLRATAVAVTVGQVLAWGMGLWGLLGGGFFMLFIAFFVYASATQEGRLVRARGVLGDLRVENTYSRQAHTVRPEAPLQQVVHLMLRGFQSDFPVCDGERLVGLLTRDGLIEAWARCGLEGQVGDAILADVTPVAPEEPLHTVRQRLAEAGLNALPVVREGRFLGLITREDVEEIYRLVARRPELAAAGNTGRL
jgi:Zn-dependent protease/CBS domain-containing protein